MRPAKKDSISAINAALDAAEADGTLDASDLDENDDLDTGEDDGADDTDDAGDDADESDDDADDGDADGDDDSGEEGDGSNGDDTGADDDDADGRGDADDGDDAGDADGADGDDDAKHAARVAGARDELDDLLDSLGFKLPKPGQKVNRQPPERVRARVKKAIKKLEDKWGLERGDLTGKVSKYELELTGYRNMDAMVEAGAKDPAKARDFIMKLAAIHPAYAAFLGDPKQPGGAVVPTTDADVAAAVKELGPKPGPDIKYDDGTRGYSDEQLEKREEWLVKKATIEANANTIKQLDARFKPIADRDAALATQRADADAAAKRIDKLRTHWGTLFTDQEAAETKQKGSSELGKYIATHPGVSLEDACFAVLLPKLRAQRTAVRRDVISEQRRRAKRSTKVVSQQSKPVVKGGKPKTAEQAIHRKLSALGLD